MLRILDYLKNCFLGLLGIAVFLGGYTIAFLCIGVFVMILPVLSMMTIIGFIIFFVPCCVILVLVVPEIRTQVRSKISAGINKVKRTLGSFVEVNNTHS
jgi:hypothetical protein